MVRVEIVDPHGRRTDVTYVAGLSLKLGDTTPEVHAVLTEWAEQRRRMMEYISGAFGVPEALLRDERHAPF